MQVISPLTALQQQIKQWRMADKRIAFVPTMGNLHAGHLDLIRCAHEHADHVVASIYVNPTQFNRIDDLEAYPRTLERDIELLTEARCDLLFTPTDKTMYPSGKLATHVVIPGVSDILEGAHRKGHFIGVATIVTKLFNLVQPDVAVFGEKDFQQLLVIRHMVRDLNVPVEIVGSPTMREADGLAMSSRNGYLLPEERIQAPYLHKALTDLRDKIFAQGGQDDYTNLQQEVVHYLQQQGFKPEYLEVRRANDLRTPQASDKALVLLASAWMGKARLIDNLTLSLG